MPTIQLRAALILAFACSAGASVSAIQGGTGGTNGMQTSPTPQSNQNNPGGTGGTPGRTGGQGQREGASSAQSSMSSSKQGTQEKSMKKGGKKGETTLTGCLSGPNAEGNYELQHGAKKVEVSSSEDLKPHVGQTVKLHGSYVKAAAMEKGESAEKGEAAEKGGMKEEKRERHFQATSIDPVSDTCKAPADMPDHSSKSSSREKRGTAPSSTPPELW